jgi:hypothetical protein
LLNVLLEKLGHDVVLLLEFGLQLFDLLVFRCVLPTHVVAVGLALEDNGTSLLRQLHREVSEPILVKYAISSSAGDIEHGWGELLKLDDTTFRATLEASMIRGEPVSAPPFDLPHSALEDWVVTLSDGLIRGGFTTQAEIQLAKPQGIPLPNHIASMHGSFREFRKTKRRNS